MGESVDDFVHELQNQIMEEIKEAYGEKTYQRWRNTTNMGSMQDPDGYACLKGMCGDTMEIFLKFGGEQVKDASFQTDGCGSSQVCGSFAAEMAVGKRPDEVLEVTGDAIMEALGGLPKDDGHWALPHHSPGVAHLIPGTRPSWLPPSFYPFPLFHSQY